MACQWCYRDVLSMCSIHSTVIFHSNIPLRLNMVRIKK